MNGFLLFPLLLIFTIEISLMKLQQINDDSIPPPTTPTDTAPWATQKHSTLKWPTDSVMWPPTMSPYPTIAPFVIPTDKKEKHTISKWIIAVIVILSVAFVAAVCISIFLICRKKRKSFYAGMKSSLLSFSDTDTLKNQ